MRATSVLLLCLMAAILTTSTTSADSHEDRCRKLHAVFTFEGVQYFIYGDGYLTGVNFKGRIVFKGWEEDLGWNHYVRAAVGVPSDRVFYLYASRDEQAFTDFDKPTRNEMYYPAYYGKAEAKLLDDHEDRKYEAAFRQEDSNVVYFSGCNYVIVDAYHMRFVKEGKNEDLGLPCHVDAAWTNEDQSAGFISKGHDLYVWERGADKVFERHLLDVFTVLEEFDLCP